MNATKAEILRLLDRFEEADNIGNQNASPMDVIESAKSVATATATVVRILIYEYYWYSRVLIYCLDFILQLKPRRVA